MWPFSPRRAAQLRRRHLSVAYPAHHRAVTARGSRRPSLRVERALQRDGYRLLAGMDEVGRGALAGPVTVGVV